MGRLIFVTDELSPFTPGGIGRVIHNLLMSMEEADRRRSIVLLLDARVSHAAFAAVFPSVLLVAIDTNSGAGRFDAFEHHPPSRAYTNTISHWKSAVVYRALRALALNEEIDYVEFPDFGGLGFSTVQEKKIRGFLERARLAVRIHSAHAVLLQEEACEVGTADLSLSDLERKTLRDCDLVVGQLGAVADSTGLALGFAPEEWTPRLIIHAPPVLTDTEPVDRVTYPCGPTTPVVFGSKLQRFKRPDLFIRGVSAFLNANRGYQGEIFVSAHSFDNNYRKAVIRLVPQEFSNRFHFDTTQNSHLRERLIAKSIFVVPSDFESFCLAAYEASRLGALVIVNENNVAFGSGTPWQDGFNCIKFNGTAAGLAQALERAFALQQPLRPVVIPPAPWPWTVRRHFDAPVSLDRESPLVSVVVPYFNLGTYVVDTLTSVIEQTHPNIEIILVDDCSTEPLSKELVESLRTLNRPLLRIVDAPANFGLAAARNLGIAAATGKYILPLDADDLIDDRFVEIAVKALERNPEFDVIVTQAGYFNERSGIALPGEERDFDDYAVFVGEALACGPLENRFSTATALFRSEQLKRTRYRESLECYEDWNLYLRLASFGCRFLVTTGVFFYYRLRRGSMVRAAEDWRVHAIFLHDMLRTTAIADRDRTPACSKAWLNEARLAVGGACLRKVTTDAHVAFERGRIARMARWYYGLHSYPLVGQTLRVMRRIAGIALRSIRRLSRRVAPVRWTER